MESRQAIDYCYAQGNSGRAHTGIWRETILESNYWKQYQAMRSSRRRFLGAAGAAGVGVAGLALAGCGDDDDGKSDAGGLATSTPAPNATPTPVDPYAGAKRGGTLKLIQGGDPPTIDPFGNLSFLTKGISGFAYSRLMKYKAERLGGDAKPVGDLAEKYETTPDGLKWTIRLRPGVKFHDVAPVSGRAVTTEDVKFSWGRATNEKNTNRSQLAFVDKVEFPDASTAVFSLKAPNVAFLDVLADTNLLFIMPTEADGKFDPAKTMIGSGPWVLESFQPSVGSKWKKNPNWHEKGFPLMDAVDYAIIPEYANRLAQFRAGNVDASDINSADVIDVKKQMPGVQYVGEISQLMSFVYFDPDPNSPWNKDERVRQAVSMCIDRDGLTDLGYNVKALKAAGVDARGPWNNIIPAGMSRFWLDPQGKDIGPGGKFFKYDLAEAKKLLSAAGYADNISATYQYVANRYGKSFDDIAQANINFMQQLGLKLTTEVQDYSSKYITQTFVGNFKGIAFGYETPFPEGGSYPIRFFTDNPNNHSKIKDATLEKLAKDQQMEVNEEKRKAIFWEIQKYHATKMYYLPNQAGAGTGWTGWQPWMRNAVELNTVPGSYGGGTETVPYRWSTK